MTVEVRAMGGVLVIVEVKLVAESEKECVGGRSEVERILSHETRRGFHSLSRG
jgi:hypothetical protein